MQRKDLQFKVDCTPALVSCHGRDVSCFPNTSVHFRQIEDAIRCYVILFTTHILLTPAKSRHEIIFNTLSPPALPIQDHKLRFNANISCPWDHDSALGS